MSQSAVCCSISQKSLSQQSEFDLMYTLPHCVLFKYNVTAVVDTNLFFLVQMTLVLISAKYHMHLKMCLIV